MKLSSARKTQRLTYFLISTSSSCGKDEAAECLIKLLYKKFKESFAAVAIEMNVMVEQEPEKRWMW
jgi:hypothetical protein